VRRQRRPRRPAFPAAATFDWLQAPDYWLTRLVIERGLGLIYGVAFLVSAMQFGPLLGERGLLPVSRFLRHAAFLDAPSVFHLHYSDRALLAVAWSGVTLSAAVVTGLVDLAPVWVSILVWFALWALYQSIVNVGQVFYGFGWETLLLEAGFLAIFLGAGSAVPAWPLILLYRWLVFRVEFGAGMIKLRGDRCWRELTCLYFHHETQPMPNPLSWFFHHLPRRLHRVEVLGNFFAQLVVPFLLFTPQPIASIAGLVIVLTQCWLVLSGNFSWLNFLTMTIAFSAFDDRALSLVLHVQQPPLVALPLWWLWLVVAVTALVVALSYRPARNLVSRRQLRSVSPRQRLRSVRVGDEGALRDRRPGHHGSGPGRSGVAGVRVPGQARRPAQGAAPVRSVPPALRLADVVRRHGLTGPAPVVHRFFAPAAGRGPADAAPPPLGPVRGQGSHRGPGQALPVSVLDLARAADERGVVGAHAGRRVRPAARARCRGRDDPRGTRVGGETRSFPW
jgi:hypothetical protein